MKTGIHVCLGVLVLGCGLRLSAQDAGRDHLDVGAQEMLNSPDKAFAIQAAQGAAAEVQLGRLAGARAADPEVKAFGLQMIEDHSKANERLKSVAQQENMTLPAILTVKDQARYDQLSKLSGAAFDKAYVIDMAKEHQADVKEFQKEARSGKDPNIKKFAAETLPILQKHLDQIRSIQAKLGGGSSM